MFRQGDGSNERERNTKLAKFPEPIRLVLNRAVFTTPGGLFISFMVPIVTFTELDAGGYAMGLLFAIERFGFVLGSPIVGYFVNRPEWRPRLVKVGAVWRFANYLLIYYGLITSSYPVLAFGVWSIGLGGSAYWVPIRASLADGTEYNRRAEIFGLYRQRTSVGTFFGSGFGFFLYGLGGQMGWDAAWTYLAIPIYALSNLYGGLGIAKQLGKIELIDHVDPAVEGEEAAKLLRGINRVRHIAFVGLLFVTFGSAVVGSLVGPFLKVYLLQTISTDPILILIMFVPGGTLSMLLAPTMGRLADRFHPAYWLSVTGVLGAAATFALLQLSNPLLIMILFTIDSLVIASGGLVFSKLMSNYSRGRRGTVFALGGVATKAGGICGPLLGGIVWESVDPTAPFYISIVAELILAFIYPPLLALVSYGKLTGTLEDKRARVNAPRGTP